MDDNKTTVAASPADQPKEPKVDERAQHAARVDAFQKNLIYLWDESLALFGLPLDALMVFAFRHAAGVGLPANGSMVNYGANSGFVPNKDTFGLWLKDYFRAAQEADKQAQTEQPSTQSQPAVPEA